MVMLVMLVRVIRRGGGEVTAVIADVARLLVEQADEGLTAADARSE